MDWFILGWLLGKKQAEHSAPTPTPTPSDYCEYCGCFPQAVISIVIISICILVLV